MLVKPRAREFLMSLGTSLARDERLKLLNTEILFPDPGRNWRSTCPRRLREADAACRRTPSAGSAKNCRPARSSVRPVRHCDSVSDATTVAHRLPPRTNEDVVDESARAHNQSHRRPPIVAAAIIRTLAPSVQRKAHRAMQSISASEARACYNSRACIRVLRAEPSVLTSSSAPQRTTERGAYTSVLTEGQVSDQ